MNSVLLHGSFPAGLRRSQGPSQESSSLPTTARHLFARFGRLPSGPASRCSALRSSKASARANATPSVDESPEKSQGPPQAAVVVGGGPVGLAAALALSRIRGWSDITLVEKAEKLTSEDPALSYVYGIDGRGQAALKMLGLFEELEAASCRSSDAALTTVDQSGKAVTVTRVTKDLSSVVYLVSRPALLQILAKGLSGRSGERESSGVQGDADAGGAEGARDAGISGAEGVRVRVLTSSRLVRIERAPAEDGKAPGVRVQAVIGACEGTDAEQDLVLSPSLILGCDGLNSLVRKTLQQWAQEDLQSSPQQQGQQAPSFELATFPSPSAFRRFKVLRLPPNPVLRNGTVLSNPTFVSLRGSLKGVPWTMPLFPNRDTKAQRTADTVAKPDHPLWAIPCGDVAAYRAALKEAFPQIDILGQASPEDVEAFAESKGGAFPQPQASQGVAYVVGLREQGNGPHCAVLLLGDSAHAFPPDVGQGVNSGLQDVQALVKHLEENNNNVTSTALAYGADRGPEAVAVARLAALSFMGDGTLVSDIKMRGFTVRKALSRLLGGTLVAPPATIMVQNPELRYAEIMHRADETTRLFGGVLGVLLGGVISLACYLLLP